LKIKFEKYQGTGNDFVILDNRLREFDQISAATVSALCHLKFGIGSDGLMLIQEVENADFEMVFFNPDGSKSLCGNGSRCAVIFAESLGLASAQGSFITTDGRHSYRLLNNREVSVQMLPVGLPRLVQGHLFLNTGSPHLVVNTENVDAVDVVGEGRRLRHLAEFEKTGGTNVNFLARMDDNSIGVRTFERGVESETLSCGTGVTAAALSLSSQNLETTTVKVHTHGGVLRVKYRRTAEGFEDIWLEGPAQKVFSGEFEWNNA
jgi:diaminopimelate epimerase